MGLGRSTPGVVGPMSSEGLGMPNVELAFAAMEGRGGSDEGVATPSMPRRVRMAAKRRVNKVDDADCSPFSLGVPADGTVQ